MATMTDVGVRAVIQDLNGFLRGMQQMQNAMRLTGSQATTTSQNFSSMGVGVAAGIGAAFGTAAIGMIRAVKDELISLGGEALASIATWERMGIMYESLLTRDFMRGRQREQQRQVIIELTQQEREEMADLQGDLKVMQASQNHALAQARELTQKIYQEAPGLDQSEMIARYAEADARFAETNREMAKKEKRIQELTEKSGKLVTVNERVFESEMVLADAMEAAKGPAKEVLQWMIDLGLQSPFGMEDVANAYRLAQSYTFTSSAVEGLAKGFEGVKQAQDKGLLTTERMTTAMLDLGAASGWGPEAIQRLAYAFGQIRTLGRLVGYETRQLTEVGVDVDIILSKAFKKSTAEIVKMRENGLLPANETIKAIIENIESWAGGKSKEVADTWSGVLQNLEDVRELVLRELFTGFFEPFRQPLIDFVDMFDTQEKRDKILKPVRELGERLADIAGFIMNAADKVLWMTNLLAGGIQAAFFPRGAGLKFFQDITEVTEEEYGQLERTGRKGGEKVVKGFEDAAKWYVKTTLRTEIEEGTKPLPQYLEDRLGWVFRRVAVPGAGIVEYWEKVSIADMMSEQLASLGQEMAASAKAMWDEMKTWPTDFWWWLTGPGGAIEFTRAHLYTVGQAIGAAWSSVAAGITGVDVTQNIEDALIQGTSLDISKKIAEKNKWNENFWLWLTGPGGAITQAESKITEITNALDIAWRNTDLTRFDWATKYWRAVLGIGGTWDKFGDLLNEVGDFLNRQDVQKLAEVWGRLIGKSLGMGLRMVGDFISAAGDTRGDITTSMEDALTQGTSIAVSQQTIWDAIAADIAYNIGIGIAKIGIGFVRIGWGISNNIVKGIIEGLAITEEWSKFRGAITSGLERDRQAVRDWAQGLSEEIKEFFVGREAKVGGFGEIYPGISGLIERIRDAIVEQLGLTKFAEGDFKGFASEVLGKLWPELGVAIEADKGGAKTVIGAVLNVLTEAIKETDWGQIAADIVSAIWSKVEEGLSKKTEQRRGPGATQPIRPPTTVPGEESTGTGPTTQELRRAEDTYEEVGVAIATSMQAGIDKQFERSSPSKWMIQLGKDMSVSLEVGVEAEKAGEAIGTAYQQGIANAIGDPTGPLEDGLPPLDPNQIPGGKKPGEGWPWEVPAGWDWLSGNPPVPAGGKSQEQKYRQGIRKFFRDYTDYIARMIKEVQQKFGTMMVDTGKGWPIELGEALIASVKRTKAPIITETAETFVDIFKAWGDAILPEGPFGKDIHQAMEKLIRSIIPKDLEDLMVMPGETWSDVAKRMVQQILDNPWLAKMPQVIRDQFKNNIEPLIQMLGSLADQAATEAYYMASRIFDILGVLSSMASAVADRWRTQVLDPLIESIEALENELGGGADDAVVKVKDRLKEIEEMDFWKFFVGRAPGTSEWLGAQEVYTGLLEEQKRLLARQAEIQAELAEKTAERARIEEKLAALEKQQADIAFLQQQYELLKLIREQGLDAKELLGGLKLGLDADLELVLAAMTKAMQQLIEQAKKELGVASESKVFTNIGKMVQAGLGRGLESGAIVPLRQMVSTVGAMVRVGAGLVPTVMGSTVNNTFNATINNGMDQAAFTYMVRQAVARAI